MGLLRFCLVFGVGAVCLLFLVGCSSFQGVQSEEKALYHMKMGVSHLQQGRYPMALDELLKAEEEDPSNAQVQNNLAIAYFVRKRFLKAEHHARRALSLKSDYTEARNNLGRILVEQGAINEAISVLEVAANDLTFAFPERSLSNLGIAYFYNDQFNEAAQALRKSLDLRQDHCLTNSFYGRSLFALDKFDQAAIAFDRAIRACKKQGYDEPLYYSALSYYKMGQPEESITRLQNLIKTYPEGSYLEKAKNMLQIIR